MLLKIRIILAVLALSAFAGWWTMRKPYSPADSLERVYYPAFEIAGIDSTAGKKLALDVRYWPGITAAAFNIQSALLSLSCVEGTDEAALIQKLQNSTGTTVTKKVFTAPAGPQCPVPVEVIQRLPVYMLYAGFLFSSLLSFTFFPFLFKK